MRSLLFWSALPFVMPQALWVRARAPRFAGPAAAAEGLAAPGAPHTRSRSADSPPLRLLGLGDSLIEGVGVTRAEDCLTACCAREVAVARSVGARSGAAAQRLRSARAPRGYSVSVTVRSPTPTVTSIGSRPRPLPAMLPPTQ